MPANMQALIKQAGISQKELDKVFDPKTKKVDEEGLKKLLEAKRAQGAEISKAPADLGNTEVIDSAPPTGEADPANIFLNGASTIAKKQLKPVVYAKLHITFNKVAFKSPAAMLLSNLFAFYNIPLIGPTVFGSAANMLDKAVGNSNNLLENKFLKALPGVKNIIDKLKASGLDQTIDAKSFAIKSKEFANDNGDFALFSKTLKTGHKDLPEFLAEGFSNFITETFDISSITKLTSMKLGANINTKGMADGAMNGITSLFNKIPNPLAGKKAVSI
jgi:hypothetical protein